MIHCIEYDEALMCPAPVGELESIANGNFRCHEHEFPHFRCFKGPMFQAFRLSCLFIYFYFLFFLTIKQVYVLFKGALCSLGEEI